jgi:hypothetical protein
MEKTSILICLLHITITEPSDLSSFQELTSFGRERLQTVMFQQTRLLRKQKVPVILDGLLHRIKVARIYQAGVSSS